MTDDFSADWLALRAGPDRAARSESLAMAFLDRLPPRPRVLDLGAGAGANARYLDRLAAARGQAVTWRLVDRDRALLDGIDDLPGAAREILDFAGNPASLNLVSVDAISASALFDLVSADWFGRFVATAAGRPLLLALTAQGVHRWDPGDDSDAAVMGWFDRDTRRDKGFGPAMGLTAPSVMADCLVGAGYRVRQAASDWRLDRAHSALLGAMIDGVADTAVAQGDPEQVEKWRDRRHQSAAEGGLRLMVGHRDILALPEGA